MYVNHEVKGNLARLLATENLVIEHKQVSTASFDVVNRVLVLPLWDKASDVVYDLLVGHEVGHALYTPVENWIEKTSIPVPPDYINVVEDARVEKLMKRKYPGLAKTFYSGYNQLNDEDFFSIADEDVSKMSLIDRINLHFKIGAFSLMPFNEKENEFVGMISEAETFSDVITICELIVNYLRDQYQKEDELTPEQSGEQGSSDSSSQSNMSSSSTSGFDSGDSEGVENSIEDGTPETISGGGGADETVSQTQRSFDEATEDLTGDYASETEYVEIPELYMDNIIVGNEDLRGHINQSYTEMEVEYSDRFNGVDQDYREYKKSAQKEVNYLVKEFECKKSADAYARASVSKTGVLDTKMLHTYKYNDDLFKKVSVIPDGKNHGLIFILDWSGSMYDYMLDTVKQLLNLCWFCRKVQIPFDVYAFTYDWSPRILNPELDELPAKCDRKDRTINIHKRFSLLNFLSSNTTGKEFENDCRNLFRLGASCDRKSCYYLHTPIGLELSGTPLNESIISLHKIIPAFKNANDLQKVNVVILTDGESSGIQYNVDVSRKYGRDVDYMGTGNVNYSTALRDRKTGNVYRNFNDSYHDSVTSILLENLKDNFPYVNLIGFRILSGTDFGNLFRAIIKFDYRHDQSKLLSEMKKWRKNGFYEFNEVGYDALYALACTKINQEAEFVVKDDVTNAQLGKAFRDMMKTKRSNKKILSSFATLVS